MHTLPFIVQLFRVGWTSPILYMYVRAYVCTHRKNVPYTQQASLQLPIALHKKPKKHTSMQLYMAEERFKSKPKAFELIEHFGA